jgi:hypothetical protein
MNKEPNGYPEAWVHAACAHIYGDPIAKRTWEKYKNICKVPDFRKLKREQPRLISKTHCQWLMMLAYMRYEQKREGKTKRPVGRGSKIELKQVVAKLNSSPALIQELDEALGDAVIADGVKGEDVPYWLSQKVGRCPSVKTLRRWAKKYKLEFSTHKPVPIATLDIFLKIA